MRVIAGSARGRRLENVAGDRVRPTADRVKEALFSMLGSRFVLDGADVLDLFAGSGALGIEALSRGAATAVFVERDADVLRVLRRNLERCRFAAEVVSLPVRAAIARFVAEGRSFSGVFLDPPYATTDLEESLARLGASPLVRPAGWVVAEHSNAKPVLESYGELHLLLRRRYGSSVVSLFERMTPDRLHGEG